MNTSNRRRFIKQTGTALAATGALGLGRATAADRSSNQITLGIIGPGGMGTNLLKSFVGQPGVRIARVCDVDSNRRANAAKLVADKTGKAPQQDTDMRRIFDDKSIDAVIIATPDHWHAPATILACDAGKHVYVEKPCSHNLREGRLMIEAARRNKRIVQVGTQSRSTEHVRRAVELLRNGAIGEVLAAKAWNSQLRRSIGHEQPSKPPAELDFDSWVGPAPMVPYQSNMLHSIWRWWHAFGTGDIGNDGVHDIDIARWGLGVETHPSRISALGGKYFFDDDQQFPDTQYVVFEYDVPSARQKKKQLVFEQRIWSPYVQEGHENGDAFYGTDGMLVLGKGGGWKLFGPRNKLKEEMKGRPDGPAHHRNFLESVRSGKLPNADIEIGHLSTSLCHLANIATRQSATLEFDPVRERFTNHDAANQMLTREYRSHWATPEVGG